MSVAEVTEKTALFKIYVVAFVVRLISRFSFICSDGQWRLAPAYDLTNDQTLGEHATSINFKGLPTIEDMIVVGTNIKMTKQRCREIIDEVATVVKKM